MKRIATLLTTIISGFIISIQLSAQCDPDTTCKDTGDPGQFCPLNLPAAGLDIPYDEVVTIIPPGSYSISQAGTLTILYIEIDSVNNLPPGIDYIPGADRFYPDTAYCIELTGTPTQTGAFALSIHILATVDLFGTPTGIPVVNDTSVVITVVDNLGTQPIGPSQFRVYQNVPNPFSEMTRLGYYTPEEQRIELSVYNVVGVLVHHEYDMAAPGEHYFRFDGSELQPGTYLFKVSTGETYFTGKLMKSR
jgi:hypothetical protein